MKVIDWFDYLYYRTYRTYLHKWKDNMPWLYALCLVTILQVFNLSTFLFVYIFIASSSYRPNKLHGVVIFFVLFFINRVRYTSDKTGYKSLSEKWDKEAGIQRERKGYLVVSYVIVSFVVFFALAALLGAINQGKL